MIIFAAADNGMRKYLLYILVLCTCLLQAREYVNLHQQNPQQDSLVMAGLQHKWLQSIGLPCTYRSVDQHGDSVTLSGKIYLPKEGVATRIVLLPHYTVTGNHEVPSECDPAEALLKKKNLVLLMPDYIGYGISSDRVHPYLAVDLAARNTADMLKAAEPFLARLGRSPKSDSIIIAGYSQGAATAIGTLRLLETERPEVKVLKCYAGSGPYDVATTYDVAVRDNHTGIGLSVPMLICGTSVAYDLHLRPEKLMHPDLLNKYEADILSKKYGIFRLFLLKRYGSRKLDELMSAEGMDKTQPETARMYEGFLRSSLVHVGEGRQNLGEWRPRTPILLFHSVSDDCVPYENAISLSTMLGETGAKVTYHFGDYGGHIRSLTKYLKLLNEEIKD